MKNNTDACWPLESGTWRHDVETSKFKLQETRLKNPVAQRLSVKELAALGVVRLSEGEIYPLEFDYNPSNRSQLPEPVQSDRSSSWVAPHGGAVRKNSPTMQGLNQSIHSFKPKNLDLLDSSSRAEFEQLSPPPEPGVFQYLSVRAGSRKRLLLAVEPYHGALYVWVSEQGGQALPGKWYLMHNRSNGGNSFGITDIGLSSWRCVVDEGEFSSKIYLPTKHGLACITPDAAALSYSIRYFSVEKSGKKYEVAGSPVIFEQRIWFPVMSGASVLLLAIDDADGMNIEAEALLEEIASEAFFQAPQASQSYTVWRNSQGYVQLVSGQPGQGYQASFTKWSEGKKPEFRLGCPYLDKKRGKLWQLAWDENGETFGYTQLASPNEWRKATTPCTTSGRVSYRVKGRQKAEIWEDPESTHDTAEGLDIAFPLLESADNLGQVLGVVIKEAGAVASIFDKQGQQWSADLFFDPGNGIIKVFHRLVCKSPWETRFFQYDGKLWCVHPDSGQLFGWELEG